jgi:hypothetical protein
MLSPPRHLAKGFCATVVFQVKTRGECIQDPMYP